MSPWGMKLYLAENCWPRSLAAYSYGREKEVKQMHSFSIVLSDGLFQGICPCTARLEVSHVIYQMHMQDHSLAVFLHDFS